MCARSMLTVMSLFILRLLSIFACISCVLAASNSSCYYPSGLEYRGSPCDANALVSPCCGPGFICLSNGLCRPGPAVEGDRNYEYYRSGCTDSSFNSTDCPRVCIGPNDKLDSGETLQSCGQNRYCCTTNSDCCANEDAVFELGAANIVTTISARSSKSASTSQSTSSASTTTTTTPAPTPPATSNNNDKSNAIAIGVGVGVGVGGFLALVLAVVLILRYRRNKRNVSNHGTTGLEGMEESRAIGDSDATTKYAFNSGKPELDGYTTTPVQKDPQELDHEPIYEIGSSMQPAEGLKAGRGDGNESPGRYFKEDGTRRHEVP